MLTCLLRSQLTSMCFTYLLYHCGLYGLQVSRPEFVEYLCGNRVLPGSEPASHCYCGHQFGHFAGQLGDGCAQLVSYFL